MLVRYRQWLDSLPYPLDMVVWAIGSVFLFLLTDLAWLVFPDKVDKALDDLDVDYTRRQAEMQARIAQEIKAIEARAVETRKLLKALRGIRVEHEMLQAYMAEVLEALEASEREDWEIAQELRRA